MAERNKGGRDEIFTFRNGIVITWFGHCFAISIHIYESNRKWGECDRCGARVPMYTEPHIIGNPVTPTK